MARFLSPALLLILLPVVTSGGEPKDAATLASPFGTVLVRTLDQKLALPSYKQPVPMEQELMTLPGMRGLIDLKKGIVRLHLIGHLPETSSTRALESVVKLHVAAGNDADFTLERGLALIENRQEKAAVKILVRVGKKVLNLELSAGAKAGVEQVSYWPEGSPFSPKGDKKVRTPVQELSLFVLQGDASVEVDDEKQAVKGPVLYQWSNLQPRVGPVQLTQIPAWSASPASVPGPIDALQKAGDKLRRQLEKKDATVASAVDSEDANLRAVVALSAGALHDVELAFALLNKDKAKTVRDAAAAGLRHFQGRSQADENRIFDAITKAQLKAGPATIVMELLHGLPAAARNRPETYDTLIDYLQHDVQAIRHLAADQLVRMAPKGKAINYDAAAAADQRAEAQAAWRKLVRDELKQR